MTVKFIYSEKATKFCEISPLHLSYVAPVKSKVEISQNFVAFSEYMNFTVMHCMEQIGEGQGDTDKGDTKQHIKGVQGQ